jgi:hypothetical protein
MLSIVLDAVSTLDKIIRNQREIQVWCEKCQACRILTQDELIALAAKVGPDYSLIDRRCRCRLTPGCKQGVFRPMTTPEGNAARVRRDMARNSKS